MGFLLLENAYTLVPFLLNLSLHRLKATISKEKRCIHQQYLWRNLEIYFVFVFFSLILKEIRYFQIQGHINKNINYLYTIPLECKWSRPNMISAA